MSLREYLTLTSRQKGNREMTKGEMLDEILDLLQGENVLKRKNHTIETRQPFHGSCCCCQSCGYAYDECVCQHNRVFEELHRIFREYKE